MVNLKLLELCDYYDITYTRYADDLTFSSDELYLLLSLMKDISNIIRYYGFKINYEKTKVLLPSNKQTITGITVNNGEIKVDKKLKRMVRAKLYYGIKNNDIKNFDILLGFISYICSIEIGYKSKMVSYIKYLLNKFGKNDIWGLIKILDK